LGDNFDEKDKNGVLYLTIDAESSVYNINKEVSIELPEITEENSFDVLKGFMPILSGIGSAPGIGEEDYTYDIPALSDGINVVMNGKVVYFPDVKPENVNGKSVGSNKNHIRGNGSGSNL